MSDAARRKAKQKSAVEKPKLDNARKSRGIYFIDLDAEEFKRIMCRLQLHKHRETCGTVGQYKTKYACVVEADESMRI